MSIDAETSDPTGPIVITHEAARPSIWVSIARAVVSFTLLAVLLLAFGVAIAGWFLQNSIRADLERELDRTPIQAQMVVAYRDALAELTERMSSERAVVSPPDQSEIYERVLDDRQGRGATLNGAGAANLQEQIDLVQRDNADLRWANDQLRRQTALSRNPPVPSRNQAP
ncbi:MAG: hypothetical protein AB7G40_18110 [Hyphomonadaceae bacterium]